MTHDETLAAAEPVDLLGMPGSGPLWGMASADLNATLLSWPSGHEVPEHVNEELDVLIVVLTGRGTVMIDGRPHDLGPGSAILVPRGVRRRIVASDSGVRYLSIHRRRGPLQIEPLR
ncbi:MAG TPA: cupin domain-containing protein [Solirubrobacteraceae bacterium]|nr:cupin domain-containing protein [Solirubrobacteraceae bacterium]